jgi:hypothetical protein
LPIEQVLWASERAGAVFAGQISCNEVRRLGREYSLLKRGTIGGIRGMSNRGIRGLPMKLGRVNELRFQARFASVPHNVGDVGAATAGIQAMQR